MLHRWEEPQNAEFYIEIKSACWVLWQRDLGKRWLGFPLLFVTGKKNQTYWGYALTAPSHVWPEEEGFLPDSLSELPSVCCSPLSWSCDPVGAVGFFPAPGARNRLLSQEFFSRLPLLLLLGDMSVLGTHGLGFPSLNWESVSGFAWLLKRLEACGSVIGSPMLGAATRFPVMPFSAVARLIGGAASRPFKGSRKLLESSVKE